MGLKKPLSKETCRTDLTDRECASVLGGVIGTLASMSDIATLRNAVRWWAETDEAWRSVQATKEFADSYKGGKEASS
jgi:hypothetical protein